MTGPRPLARTVARVAAKALGKRGQAFAALLSDWGSIMGPELAGRTAPVRLAFPAGQREGAVLTLRAHGSAALELQHAEPQILERINAYFGFRAVARLKLVHGASPAPRQPSRRPRPLDAAAEARIAEATAAIEDETLRLALADLGRAIAARERG